MPAKPTLINVCLNTIVTSTTAVSAGASLSVCNFS